MRAFHTATDLFLQLTWLDATPDRALMEWVAGEDGWTNNGSQEDGFGLMWDAVGGFPRFTCAYACHIRDFGVSRSAFHASNRMQLAAGDAWLDLWNWKADRTARYGFADDRFVDREGMRGDRPGELFQPNSLLARDAAEAATPFGEGDRPLYDADNRPLGGRPPAGSRVPGYLVERPAEGRADVAATAQHHDGRWCVVLRRALDTGDRRDVVFVPGDPQGIAFGLAVMDHTLFEHYASTVPETLVLLHEVQAQDLPDLSAD
jgi:hypothetical protein